MICQWVTSTAVIICQDMINEFILIINLILSAFTGSLFSTKFQISIPGYYSGTFNPLPSASAPSVSLGYADLKVPVVSNFLGLIPPQTIQYLNVSHAEEIAANLTSNIRIQVVEYGNNLWSIMGVMLGLFLLLLLLELLPVAFYTAREYVAQRSTRTYLYRILVNLKTYNELVSRSISADLKKPLQFDKISKKKIKEFWSSKLTTDIKWILFTYGKHQFNHLSVLQEGTEKEGNVGEILRSFDEVTFCFIRFKNTRKSFRKTQQEKYFFFTWIPQDGNTESKVAVSLQKPKIIQLTVLDYKIQPEELDQIEEVDKLSRKLQSLRRI